MLDRSNVTYYTYDELGRMIMSYDGYMGARTRYTYDANNRLIESYRGTTGKGTYVWSDTYETYTYNVNESDTISDGTLTGMQMLTGANISLGYDYLQRLTTRTTASALTETYAYTAGNGTNRTTVLVSGKINTLGGSVKNNFTYTYDANGNIKTVTDSANSRSITYTYDNQGQLLKAVHSDGRTETYTYDSVGNILTFNNGSTSKTFTYGDSQWKDLLTKVNGVTITYDAVGNPISYYNGSSYTLNWTEGRKLYMAGTGGTQTYYSYNMDGLRRTKIYSDESGINYIIVDGRTVGEEHFDSDEDVTAYIRYTFDENGSVCGYSVSANGTSWTNYYFIKNLQGDVLQVFQAGTNTVVASYTYDSWGNILSATGSQAHINPFRYRSYYFDQESGFYYCGSRYYDPAIGRFINADTIASTGQGILGLNMYAYCGNNPIMKKDSEGHTPETIFDIISLGTSIIEVAVNPADFWAWAGLIGDIVDVAVPFVGGVGEATKALKAASAVAENADDFVDATKMMGKIDDAADAIQKGWHVGDNITNLTKAGNIPSWSTVRQRFWKNEAHFHPELYSDDLERLLKGRAPIGEDGFSMELHHPNGRSGENYFIFEPITQTLHRWIHYGE